MFSGRTLGKTLMLDLLVKHVLLYKFESARIFSTKNVSAVNNWRQLKPRAPRKRKQTKESTTKVTRIVATSKSKSSLSIQALESSSGPAQRKKDRNKTLGKFDNVPEVFLGEKQKKLFSSVKLAPNKEESNTDTVQGEQVKETSAEDVKSAAVAAAADDISENKVVDFSKWKFHNASFLGCTAGEVTQRVKELSQAGFCNEHIDLLLRRLPPTLQINSKIVYQNVNSFIKWNIPWKQFVDKNPEILLLEPSQVFYGL